MTSAVRTTCLVALLGTVALAPVPFHPLAAAAIWGCCLVLLVWSEPRGALSLGFLYVALLGLFHLGLVVPAALGYAGGPAPSWTRSSHLPQALRLFTLASVAFTLGARLVRAPAAERRELTAEPHVFAAGYAVALLGAAVLWKGVLDLGFLSSGYATFFVRAMHDDVRLFGFGLMLFPIGVLVAAAGASPRQLVAVGATLAVVLGPLFFAGFRGPVIVQAVALLAVWAHKDLRTARRLALVGACLAVAAVPAIRAARDREGGSEARGGPLAVLSETGSSLYPLVITVERIDRNQEEPWLGASYLMAAGRVVLNVSRDRVTMNRLTPSAWATKHGDFWAFENGGGIGFSGVAEPYLNFGTWGVVLHFLLLGLLVRAWERWFGAGPFRAAIAAATFGFVLWTVRNDLMDVFRAAALACGTVAGARVLALFWHQRPPAELDAAEE